MMIHFPEIDGVIVSEWLMSFTFTFYMCVL